MAVPFFDLRTQTAALRSGILPAIERVMGSCAFSGGEEVSAFEREFAAFLGAAHAVGVGSGTGALGLAFRALDLRPGDEVVVPALTFFATAEAVALAGGRPVFADVDPRTAQIDPASVERAVGPRTRGIVPVHLYGQPADLGPILEIGQRRGLWVVEDACQAHGARWGGRAVGTLGIAGAFSFYPSKNLGAFGEAGAVVTSDAGLARRVRMLRGHGSEEKYRHAAVGRNERMDGIQAAVLRVKLPRLAAWNEQRRKLAARYRARLREIPGLVLLAEVPGTEPVHHLFVVRVPRRDQVRESLERAGIGTGIHYPVPLHLQEAFAQLGGRPGDLPAAETLAREALSLPLYPEMADADVDLVIEHIQQGMAP